jgi:hypothetical protein
MNADIANLEKLRKNRTLTDDDRPVYEELITNLETKLRASLSAILEMQIQIDLQDEKIE